jgi:hypothetical protein
MYARLQSIIRLSIMYARLQSVIRLSIIRFVA